MEKKPTAGIILAAGMSTRFGRPKQLLKLKGKYLLEWVLDAGLESKLESLIIVLGHESQKIHRTLGKKAQLPSLEVVINQRYQEGLSQSLRAGLLRVRQRFGSVMFLLGDQPLVNSKTIDYLLEQFWRSEKDICAPVYQGEKGNPTIFSRLLFDRLLEIQGDIGARNIIQAYPERVLYVELKDPLFFSDIDTKKDLEDIRAALS
jgi:molybdenum cofactor cytidylyltransferase